MVVDSSALLTILFAEPDAARYASAIESDTIRLLSAASLLETAIVIESRYGPLGSRKLDELITAAQIEIEPVTTEQVALARVAYRTYGKGQHPASLNFGDCFPYALAKFTGEALLYKGNDFSQTDILSVLSTLSP